MREEKYRHKKRTAREQPFKVIMCLAECVFYLISISFFV